MAALAQATPPPTSLTVLRDSYPAGTVTLAWNGSASTGDYKVYRTTALPVVLAPGNLVQTIPAINSTASWVDAIGPTPPYFYAITEDDLTPGGESVLSNTAGYIEVEALGGVGEVFTPFGVPFVTWDILTGAPQYGSASSRPSDVIREQSEFGLINTADRVINMTNFHTAWRNSSNVWAGTLETTPGMDRGKGFYYSNRVSRPTRSIIICGEVDHSGAGFSYSLLIPDPTPGPYVVRPFSWPEARVLPVSQLELLTDGFLGGANASDSDLLVCMGPVDNGKFAWYDNVNGWTGTLTHVTPGQVYYIVNQHPGHSWNFTYSFNLLP
ncbi:hypothetical protein IT157_07260 [bacterium]|nr:hypothetical protein [bacterium]